MKKTLKLHRNPDRAKTNARFDTQKLENEMFKSRFSVELRNKCAILEVEEIVNEDCMQMETFIQKLPKTSQVKQRRKTSNGLWGKPGKQY